MLRPTHPKAVYFSKQGLFEDLKSFATLEERISSLPETERGDAFEVFAEAYLATNPLADVAELWTKAPPPSVVENLRLNQSGIGADGLIRTRSGQFRAYQVKYRTHRKALTWAVLSTFFGITDGSVDRLLFTNSIEIGDVAEDRPRFSSIRGTVLDELTEHELVVLAGWLQGKDSKRLTATPQPHQTKAVAAITAAFRESDRATLVMPCGTGKTLISLWAAEAAEPIAVLVLVPSLALLRQTVREWLRNTVWNDYTYCCVCSDKTVTSGNDELVIRPCDLEFDVADSPERVATFLQYPTTAKRIVFATYHSSDVVAKAMPESMTFDFAVFDEAHKAASRVDGLFGFALKNENLRIGKRLFQTATPRKWNLSRRSREGEVVESYSMDDQAVFGKHAYTMSFSEAVAKGLICDFRVIISVITSDTLKARNLQGAEVVVDGVPVHAVQVANQLAVRNAVEQFRVKKIFSFHNRKAAARSFTADTPEGISSHLPQFTAFHVNGDMPAAYRDAVLCEFAKAECAIVSNARCLTEGVDLPAVDMVAFLAQHRSKTDVVQAVGRAMRTSPGTGKEYGYVLIPLYLEVRDGETAEDAVARADLDGVFTVLQALQEQDEVLDTEIHFAGACHRLRKGFGKLLSTKVQTVGDSLAIPLRQLRDAISVRCLERLVRPWDEMVQELLLYRKEFKSLAVPRQATEPWNSLAAWVDRIRSLQRNGQLSDRRVTQLTALGFDWKVEGETLDSTDGLIVESEFRKRSKVSIIARLREQGRITPAGFKVGPAGLNAYYRPEQIEGLHKSLGITIEKTQEMLTENEVRSRFPGLTGIQRYTKSGELKSCGMALVGRGGVRPVYLLSEIEAFIERRGVTLKDTTGLLTEDEIRKASGLSQVSKYREQGLIMPVGRAFSASGLSNYYRREQVAELRSALGITLESTEGLVTEKKAADSLGIKVSRLRESGRVTPRGFAMTPSAGVGAYYDLQVLRAEVAALAGNAVSRTHKKKELKSSGEKKSSKKIVAAGQLLDRTKGLIKEVEACQMLGIPKMKPYAALLELRPAGFFFVHGHRVAFYEPRRVKDSLKRLGITLIDKDGLLNEQQVRNLHRLWSIADYREKGLIKPAGFGLYNGAVRPFYRPSQVDALKRKLGITLDETDGLLQECHIREQYGLSAIHRYRERGLIKPLGYGVSAGGGVKPFYSPEQIERLKSQLGITLDSAKGLITEKQARKKGVRRLGDLRKKGLITPHGYSMVEGGVRPVYTPQQIAAVKKVMKKK
jgi:superfamily II DNA or RNA helicase